MQIWAYCNSTARGGRNLRNIKWYRCAPNPTCYARRTNERTPSLVFKAREILKANFAHVEGGHRQMERSRVASYDAIYCKCRTEAQRLSFKLYISKLPEALQLRVATR